LRYQLLNAYFNMPYTNLSNAALPRFKEERKSTLDSIAVWKQRIKDNKPVLPLQSYTGTYSNELFGEIQIEASGKDLKINFPDHRNLTATLQYMDGSQWLMTYSNPAFGIFPLQFNIENNKVISTNIKVNEFLEYDPYTFVKE
jgi:hypothetical protein